MVVMDLIWSQLEKTLAFKAALICLYLGSNISLNMLNKWTLSLYGFHFPLAMTLAHMIFSFVALAPVMMSPQFRSLHGPTLSTQWFGIVAIACLFAFNVGFNNLSLLDIPLSLNQVIRASIPVIAAIGSVLIEKKTPSSSEFFSLGVLVVGVGIAMWEGQHQSASATGVTLCALGTACAGLMMSSMGKLLGEKVDALRMTFYTAPIAVLLLLPFCLWRERDGLMEYQATHNASYMSLILLGCMNALFYNVVHVLVIKVTSAVTTTVIGEMKIVLILLLSAAMLGEGGMWTVKMLVGCTTAILGFCLYSHVKLSQHNAASQAGPIIRGVPELSSERSSERGVGSESLRKPLLANRGSVGA